MGLWRAWDEKKRRESQVISQVSLAKVRWGISDVSNRRVLIRRLISSLRFIVNYVSWDSLKLSRCPRPFTSIEHWFTQIIWIFIFITWLMLNLYHHYLAVLTKPEEDWAIESFGIKLNCSLNCRRKFCNKKICNSRGISYIICLYTWTTEILPNTLYTSILTRVWIVKVINNLCCSLNLYNEFSFQFAENSCTTTLSRFLVCNWIYWICNNCN